MVLQKIETLYSIIANIKDIQSKTNNTQYYSVIFNSQRSRVDGLYEISGFQNFTEESEYNSKNLKEIKYKNKLMLLVRDSF